MAAIKNIETGEIITVSHNPVLVGGVWECGDRRFTDPSGALFESVAPPPPSITPPQFKLLMLPDLAEIMEASKTDVTMATFLDVVNDPRLTEVDLSLQSVQNGIQYCLTKIGRTADQIGARMTQILTGKWS